jgi:hypothetical protein
MRAGIIPNRVEMSLSELKALCNDHNLPLFFLPVNKKKVYEKGWEDLEKPYVIYFTIYERVEFYHSVYKKIKKKDPKYPELYTAVTDQEKDLERRALKKIKKNPQSEDKGWRV